MRPNVKFPLGLLRSLVHRATPAIRLGLASRSRNVAVMIGLIGLFWCLFALLAPVTTIYAPQEVRFFQNASFRQAFGIMNFGDQYMRFSPLGMGLLGWLDVHVYAPLLGMQDAAVSQLAMARRLTVFHVLLAMASSAVAAHLIWRLFGDWRLVVVGVLLIGLSDTVPFQMRFMSTLVCYLLQMSAMAGIYYFVLMARDPSRRTIIGLTLSVAVALGFWEQGLNLAVALFMALGVVAYIKWRNGDRPLTTPEATAMVAIAAVVGVYLAFRLKTGMAEALSTNREASYFLSYRSVFPMLDDLLMNFSGLTLQSFRQFLPTPPLALSVIANIDMNALNTYNGLYAQHPNMPYRLMGLWYSGVSFGLSLVLVGFATRFAMRCEGRDRHLAIVAICIFVFGTATHLPIMHRDYFYIPGFALGYKISISYIGFVVLIVVAFQRFLASAVYLNLTHRRRVLLWAVGTTYFVGAAISRAVLGQLPSRFPW